MLMGHLTVDVFNDFLLFMLQFCFDALKCSIPHTFVSSQLLLLAVRTTWQLALVQWSTSPVWLVATGLARAVSNAVRVNEKSGQTEVRYLQWVASGANAAWQLQATRQVAIRARASSGAAHATLPMQMGLLKTNKRFEAVHTTLLQMRLFKTDKWFADAMDAPRVASGARSQGPTVRKIGKLTSWASVPFVRFHVVWS